MLTLFVGAFITYHVTNVLTTGVIFEGLRNRCTTRWKLDYLLRCQLCAGTWVGFFTGLLLPIPGIPLARLLSGMAFKGLAHGVLALFTAFEHAGNAAAAQAKAERDRARSASVSHIDGQQVTHPTPPPAPMFGPGGIVESVWPANESGEV